MIPINEQTVGFVFFVIFLLIFFGKISPNPKSSDGSGSNNSNKRDR